MAYNRLIILDYHNPIISLYNFYTFSHKITWLTLEEEIFFWKQNNCPKHSHVSHFTKQQPYSVTEFVSS